MEFSISSTDSGPPGRRAGTGDWVQGPVVNCVSFPRGKCSCGSKL